MLTDHCVPQVKRIWIDEMIETCYTAIGWYQLSGHGPIAVVNYQGTKEHWTPEELNGKTVTIDGNQYKVRGVDMYRHMISPEHPYRNTIGILV